MLQGRLSPFMHVAVLTFDVLVCCRFDCEPFIYCDTVIVTDNRLRLFAGRHIRVRLQIFL